jgi:hypothetical protein
LLEESGIIKLTVATIVPGNDYFFFVNDSRYLSRLAISWVVELAISPEGIREFGRVLTKE